ncbi:hypothetical protein Syun_003877 [Stephania yunnanensis]|uniref:Aminotransferase-like plant mobile domain-containing protein n=1 Tax=Stephania yunnanensis TaxID=152371 RepID=A0AAP0L4J7_9MAGN
MIIRASKLSAFTQCSYRKAHKTFISAFMEKWQPETNTFHLSFGEMSIILEDVNRPLQIHVMGNMVKCDILSTAEAIELVSQALGVPEAESDKQVNKDLKVNK